MGDDESWVVKTYIDELLNFIIFTGCMFNLIESKNFDENNRCWPNNIINSNIDTKNNDELKLQWKSWFDDVTSKRGQNSELDEMYGLIEEEYDINNFLELKYISLRECCKKAYPHFIEWWNMSAGGKNAMSLYEFIGNNRIGEYIKEIEDKLGRKSKPFTLYLDIVYTAVPDVLDISDKYMVITPHGYFNLSKSWWMNKFSNLV